MTVIGRGPSVGSGVAAVPGGVGAIVGGVPAGTQSHLGLIFGQAVAYRGAQIAAGGVLVTSLGRAVALVCPAVAFVALLLRCHRGILTGREERDGALDWRPTRLGSQRSMVSASWSIPAVAEAVPGVRESAAQFARANGVPDRLMGDLRLAISEAVTNAVVHAFRHREQPGTVTVTVEVSAGRIAEVVVRDDGAGMSRRSDSPGLGLGLSLIAKLADQVEHRVPSNGAGFELWMCFRLDVT